jgi:hypothetical protein
VLFLIRFEVTIYRETAFRLIFGIKKSTEGSQFDLLSAFVIPTLFKVIREPKGGCFSFSDAFQTLI